MNRSLQNVVRFRAESRCEYCQLPEGVAVPAFEIDHIISQKHHGQTIESNLALACFWCNSAKGSDVAGYDPETGLLCPLFNPRTDAWTDHFEWDGAMLIGRTATGRTTVDLLKINDPQRARLRYMLKLEEEA